jgi:hypothetical protein
MFRKSELSLRGLHRDETVLREIAMRKTLFNELITTFSMLSVVCSLMNKTELLSSTFAVECQIFLFKHGRMSL